MSEIVVAELTPAYREQAVAVVASLPEWFGYEGALADVGHAAASQAGFVAIDDGAVVGFVTTVPVFEETTEITYLTVRAGRRGSGVGRRLVGAVSAATIERGAAAVSLLTLGPAAGSPHYKETVGFYRSIGFWATKELYLTAWGGAPTLVMSGPAEAIARGCERR